VNVISVVTCNHGAVLCVISASDVSFGLGLKAEIFGLGLGSDADCSRKCMKPRKKT